MSSEPPTTIFEERPTIPMWGLTGVTPVRPPAEAKAEIAPPAAPAPAPVATVPTPAPMPAPAPVAAVEPAPPAPAAKSRPARLPAPTFGAGMLQARKVRTPDPEITQRVRAVADGPTFGANVLRAQNSAGKWVALALALAAVAAVIVAAL